MSGTGNLGACFDVDDVNVDDGCAVIVIDRNFCSAVANALVGHRCFNRYGQKVPNPALEALGHLVGQAGMVLHGEDAHRFPKLAGKVTPAKEATETPIELPVVSS